jgi:hypothetical protein
MQRSEIDKEFVSPLNDYVFKSIYGEQKNIENTKGFLKTILEIPSEDYLGLTVADPFLKRRWRKDKQGIVDLRLSTASGRQISVELQVLSRRAMRERLVYYSTRILADQMKSGFKYETLRQTITVVITDYDLLPQESSYLNWFELRNRKSGALFTDIRAAQAGGGHPAALQRPDNRYAPSLGGKPGNNPAEASPDHLPPGGLCGEEAPFPRRIRPGVPVH